MKKENKGIEPSHGQKLVNGVKAGLIPLGHGFYHPNWRECYRVQYKGYMNDGIVGFVTVEKPMQSALFMKSSDEVVPLWLTGS